MHGGSVRGNFTALDIVSFACLWCFTFIVAQTLRTIFLFPIYPDEIQTRIFLSRLVIDFPFRDSGTPPCASSLLQPFPYLMIVPGFLEYLIHGFITSHVVLRLVGFAFLIAWLIPVSYYFAVQLSRKTTSKFKHFIYKFIVSCCPLAIFFVGKLPFFLITNRAEQLVLPSIVALLFIVVYIDSKYFLSTALQKSLVLLLYWLSGSVILYAHPKGLFLVPFILFILIIVASRFKNFWLLIFFGASLTFQAKQAFDSWSSAYRCIEYPSFEFLLSTFSLSLGGIFTDFYGFIQAAASSLFKIYVYLSHLTFTAQVTIGYLPDIELTFVDHIVNSFVACVFVVVVAVNISFVLFLFFSVCLKSRKILTLDASLAVLVLTVFAWTVFNLTKNWYDAGYFYSIMAIIFLFFCANHLKEVNKNIVITALALVFGSMLSQIALISNYLEPFKMGYAGPGISIAAYDYNTTKENVLAGIDSCGIVAGNQKIFVDDLTYPFVAEYKYPLPFTYAVAIAESALDGFIASSGSDGMILRCDNIPQYAAMAQRYGEVCCLSKEALKSIPHSD